MKPSLERAIPVSLLPLALAVGALGVREATRESRRPPVAHGAVAEFVPPPQFLWASSAPGVDSSLHVDVARSSAQMTAAGRDAARDDSKLRVEGTLHILADDSLADVELDLVQDPDTPTRGWLPGMALHLRGGSARSHATAVPGVRVCNLRCSATLAGVSRDLILALTWMRLPGQTVNLQAYARLEGAPFDLPAPRWGWMLRRDANHGLGLDLVLRAKP